tara:strand:+ start:18821 stop:19024 length:204 start_codon:yes stop_codon:yes gene_type:complete
MKRVQGHSHLYRDENTGAIINTNSSQYKQRLKSLSVTKSDKDELNRLREEIDELKLLLTKLTDNAIR